MNTRIAALGLCIIVLLGTTACAAARKADSAAPTMAVTEAKPLKKEKLQIVFLFGQSNMVGLADARTAWYLTQPQYIPPRETTVYKSRYFDWNFYWSGIRYYKGPRKAEADALVDERRASRVKWRQRISGVNGIAWDEAAWGKHPGSGRGKVYPFLDAKAEEEGIYRRMAEILDSPDNQFNVTDAYNELIARDDEIAAERNRIREVYIGDATAANFDAFDAAIKTAIADKTLVTSVGKGAPFADAEQHRATYAALAQKHINLPLGKRTYVYAHGAVAGSQGQGIESTTTGPLSVGYGGGITTIGPEYGVGIALERLVDAPILLVKCSWGNTSLAGAWRAPSLDGVETTTERAMREAHNKAEAERAKKEGRPFNPRPAPTKTGQLAWCWNMVMPQVDRVLADPGKFHPDYDPEVGYEVAGLVWFQGYSDKDNPAYGELLAAMIEDFRAKVNSPQMPVVCGTLGMDSFKHLAFANEANKGMWQASQMPELVGTVDVVNTAPYYPLELDLIGQVTALVDKDSPEYKQAMLYRSRAVSEKGFHYHGSAKCFLLMGDAMGRRLANLMAGGQPLIGDDVKAVAGE